MLLSAVVLFIIAAANLLNWLLTAEQIPKRFTAFVIGQVKDPALFLILVTVLLLIVGCLIEDLAAMIVLVPILAPIAVSFGIDPVHFAMVVVLNLMIGLITPPMGLCLFVADGIARVGLPAILRRIWPLLAAELLVLAAVNMVVGVATPSIWGQLKPYQKDRITAFLNPGHDRFGSGYQIIQSEIAIGSGGAWGQGYLKGTQKNFQFLPEKHTDFVFSVAGEEFGFAGCAVVLVCYFALFSGVVGIAQTARSRFASLLAFGVTLSLILQAAVNVGVVMGLLPTKGLTLPFVSYGGSAIIASLAQAGVLVALARETG